MKTIEIRKEDNMIDRLSVFVNDEKYVLSNQSLTVQVADGKPLEVKVKFEGHVSEIKQFEPKDNMVLQISKNRILLNRYWVSSLIGAMLASFTGAFLVKTFLLYIVGIPIILVLIVLAIYGARNRKKIYTIRDVSN
jgi:hypothetical protein